MELHKNINHIPKGDITMISQKQLSLADIFEDCKDIFESDKNGIPCCPHDSSLPMKHEGSKSHLKSKLSTMKFVCPKVKLEYNRQDKSKRSVCHCDNPYTTSSCSRMIYVYPEKNLRAYYNSLLKNLFFLLTQRTEQPYIKDNSTVINIRIII